MLGEWSSVFVCWSSLSITYLWSLEETFSQWEQSMPFFLSIFYFTPFIMSLCRKRITHKTQYRFNLIFRYIHWWWFVNQYSKLCLLDSINTHRSTCDKIKNSLYSDVFTTSTYSGHYTIKSSIFKHSVIPIEAENKFNNIIKLFFEIYTEIFNLQWTLSKYVDRFGSQSCFPYYNLTTSMEGALLSISWGDVG